MKTPTLAIACRRELEIRDFVPLRYFEVVADAHAGDGVFRMRYAPKERIVERERANTVVEAAREFEGPLRVRVESRRQRPPRLHDLPSLQKLASARFGWSASKTLEVAQELYDGAGKKILTYPRAEVRYLPESAIADVPAIVAGLRAGRSYAELPVPSPPVIRRGRNGAFHDKGLEGASHHAVVPNVNTIGDLHSIWPRLSKDEKRLFDVVARSHLASVMPDYRYDEKANTFTFPEGSVPLPLFTMEGMFTRVVNTRAPGSGDGEPSAFIETSTPSLVGQMGGPVFDADAVVWGIQSHTMHHALGFRLPVPGGAAGEVEHQFLNTGLAVHAVVDRRFLDAEGIEYRSEG